jgi:hypothetical protein
MRALWGKAESAATPESHQMVLTTVPILLSKIVLQYLIGPIYLAIVVWGEL